MNPKIEPIRDQFKTDLELWQRLRHDVAHVFDRVFAAPRKGANVPWTTYGLRIGGYDHASDEIQTGDDPNAGFKLWDAIEKAFELTRLAGLVQENASPLNYSNYSPPVADEIHFKRLAIGEEKQRLQEQAKV